MIRGLGENFLGRPDEAGGLIFFSRHRSAKEKFVEKSKEVEEFIW